MNIENESYRVEVFDTAGTLDWEENRDEKDNPIQKSVGIVLVCDVTEKKSFNRIEYLYRRAHEIKSRGTSYSVTSTQPNLPCIIVCNKTDKKGSNRAVSSEQVSELANNLGCKWMETSAKCDDAMHLFIEMTKVLVASKSLVGSESL
ncbi:P-loop containing nucleoside triphosphate hydrolase protein, partial [Xylaria arbuscula]